MFNEDQINEVERELRVLPTGSIVDIDGRSHVKTHFAGKPFFVRIGSGDASTVPQIIDHARRVSLVPVITVLRTGPSPF